MGGNKHTDRRRRTDKSRRIDTETGTYFRRQPSLFSFLSIRHKRHGRKWEKLLTGATEREGWASSCNPFIVNHALFWEEGQKGNSRPERKKKREGGRFSENWGGRGHIKIVRWGWSASLIFNHLFGREVYKESRRGQTDRQTDRFGNPHQLSTVFLGTSIQVLTRTFFGFFLWNIIQNLHNLHVLTFCILI